MRTSFVDLREPSIGLRNPRLVILYRHETALFRSETTLFRSERALFRAKRAPSCPESLLCWHESAQLRFSMPGIWSEKAVRRPGWATDMPRVFHYWQFKTPDGKEHACSGVAYSISHRERTGFDPQTRGPLCSSPRAPRRVQPQ